MIKIVNAETGEVIEREMNADELAQSKADQAEIKAMKDAEKAKETAKSALLQRLGITADEAALLLQ
jgi:tRNA(Arg) A34 adenosine deaminase TadA